MPPYAPLHPPTSASKKSNRSVPLFIYVLITVVAERRAYPIPFLILHSLLTCPARTASHHYLPQHSATRCFPIIYIHSNIAHSPRVGTAPVGNNINYSQHGSVTMGNLRGNLSKKNNTCTGAPWLDKLQLHIEWNEQQNGNEYLQSSYCIGAAQQQVWHCGKRTMAEIRQISGKSINSVT